MQFGLGVLGLSSAEFWALTPKELGIAMSAHHGELVPPEPLGRTDLAALMERFPDHD